MAVEEFVTRFKATGASDVARDFDRLAGSAHLLSMAGANGIETMATAWLHFGETAVRTAVLASTAIAGTIAGIGVAALKTTADLQRLQLQLNTLYGSAAAGRKAMEWVMATEKGTPYKLSQVGTWMATMESLHLEPRRNMRTLMDYAAATGTGSAGIDSVLNAMGKSMGAGKLVMEGMEDQPILRSLVNETVREMLRVPAGRPLGDVGSLNLSSAPVLDRVLKKMDERWGGASAIGARTLEGLWSTLQSAMERLSLVIGSRLVPLAEKWITSVTDWMTDDRVKEGFGRLYSIVAGLLEQVNVSRLLDGLQKIMHFEWIFTAARWLVAAFFTVKLAVDNVGNWIKIGFDRLVSGFASFMAMFADTVGGLASWIMNSDVAKRYGGWDETTGGGGLFHSGPARRVHHPGAADYWRQVADRWGAEAAANNDPATWGAIKANVDRQWGGVQGFVGRWQARADELTRQPLDLVPVPLGKTGRTGRDVGLTGAGAAAAAGTAQTLERFFLGGGEFTRRWAGMLPYGAGHAGGQPVRVRVESGDGSPLGKAVEQIATSVLGAALRDRGVLRQLKSALGTL